MLAPRDLSLLPRLRRALTDPARQIPLAFAVALIGLAALWGGVARPQVEAGWTLIFDESFDGAELDTAIWSTCYFWAADGCTNAGNDELQWYQPDAARVDDGILRLVAEERTRAGFAYTSGMISSEPGFAFRYGYVEARARVPRGQGLWPAVWLLPDPERGWPPEIDVMEAKGQNPREIVMTVHIDDPLGLWTKVYDGYRSVNHADDFHRYGVLWEPGRLTWYIDSAPRFVATYGVPDEPMYLLATLAVGGVWPGPPDATTPFPAAFELDYLRVWQAPDAARAGA